MSVSLTRRPVLFNAALLFLTAACSSSSDPKPAPADGGGTGGTGPGTGGAGPGTGGVGPGTGGAGGSASGALTTYKLCADGVRSGDFTMTLASDYTGILGTVFDRLDTNSVSVQVGSPFGECRLMKRPPPSAPCNPVCGATEECLAGKCSPKPEPISVGAVSFTGLLVPTTLKYGSGTYINVGSPHPLFAPGSDIVLNAAGDGAYAPFTLKGYGVEFMVVPAGKLRVERGMAANVTWTAAQKRGPAKVNINFSINRHGATDSWFECLVEDTGSFTISAALTDELFKHGVSGFPDVTLTRLSADATTVKSGCVHLKVISEATRELDVPGIQSCKTDDECTKPNVCRVDRVCGPDMP